MIGVEPRFFLHTRQELCCWVPSLTFLLDLHFEMGTHSVVQTELKSLFHKTGFYDPSRSDARMISEELCGVGEPDGKFSLDMSKIIAF